MTSAQPDLTTAYGLGLDAMNHVRAAAAEAGVVLPERQVVYFLPVPVDCDQVTVAVEAWAPVANELEPDALQVCASLGWHLRMFITITRKSCALVDEYGNPPSVEDMAQSLRWASDDAEVLRLTALRYGRIGQGEITFSAPQGQFQDVEMAITVPMGLL